jgi:ABC-type transporter Mla MlaB component
MTDLRTQIEPNTSICPDNVEMENISIKFIPSKRKKTRKVAVVLKGEMTINTALVIQNSVAELLPNFDVIDFSFSEITQIDLAAIQLIDLINKAGREDEKKLVFSFDLRADDRMMVQQAGFGKMLQ